MSLFNFGGPRAQLPKPRRAGPIGPFQGLTTQGNINLEGRPRAKMEDGSFATVRSMSFQNDNGEEILIPTISPDGKILSDREAMELYGQTGQHLGKFANPEAADQYAQQLHLSQEQFYGRDSGEKTMGLFNFGQQAQLPGQAGQQPGFLQRLLAPEVALPMAAALMGNQGNGQNLGNAFAFGAQGLAQQKQLQAQTAQTNKTSEWLRKQDPRYAEMLDNGFEPGEVYKLYGQERSAKKSGLLNTAEGIYDPNTETWIQPPGGGRQKPTAGQQDYEYAMNQLRERGVPEDKLPTFQEYAKPKSRGIRFRGADGTEVQIGGDDDGGYGGTSLPAEVGARIGLGDNFLKNDYPEIIKMIDAGEATGVWDYAQGLAGRGNSGVVQRRMASGADALRRGLTGAGMSASESEEYARRYLPQGTDDAETLKRKAEGLKADLEAVASGAIKGKAGDVGGFLPGPQAPAGGGGYKIIGVEN